MKDDKERDVAAPRAALAWATGSADIPGRWLYHETDIADARARGEAIHRTEFDAHAGRAWLRDVQGHAPMADLIRLTTDVDHLRIALIDLAETAANTLSSRDK